MPRDDPTLIHTYMYSLDAGDIDTAVSVFADDAVYARDAIRNLDSDLEASEPITGVDVLRGKSAIRGYLERRGRHTFTRDIVLFSQTDTTAFVEGVVTGRVEGWADAFMASAGIRDGKIVRFVALSMKMPADDARAMQQNL